MLLHQQESSTYWQYHSVSLPQHRQHLDGHTQQNPLKFYHCMPSLLSANNQIFKQYHFDDHFSRLLALARCLLEGLVQNCHITDGFLCLLCAPSYAQRIQHTWYNVQFVTELKKLAVDLLCCIKEHEHYNAKSK